MIPPHAVEDFECMVAIGKPGEFSGQIHVFVDDAGLRELVLTIRGQAVTASSTGPGSHPPE